MSMKFSGSPILAAALLLGACGSGQDTARESGDAKEAEGEVLGGSISDDMIPLGELQSQSPPMKEAPAAAAGASATGESEEGQAEPTDEAAEPALAAEEGDEG